jgi:hypothetical protein
MRRGAHANQTPRGRAAVLTEFRYACLPEQKPYAMTLDDISATKMKVKA